MREPIRKASIFLMSLGPSIAGPVLKEMPDTLIEELTAAIASIGQISADEKIAVLTEFLEKSRDISGVEFGGEESAKSILGAAFGQREADQMISRVTSYSDIKSFEKLKRIDPLTVANFLKNEHVQTVAVVLAHMDPRNSGPILALLPASMQGEVAHRISVLDAPNRETLNIVEEVIDKQISGEFAGGGKQYGGKKQVAEILNEIDRETWQEILDEVREIDDEIANDVKNLMFVFEDLVTLEDRFIQEILKEIDGKELTLALKGATKEIQDKILDNMSKRAAVGIREDMEYMGPVRLVDVEESQGRIVETVRSLEEAGTIVLGKGGKDAEMVS